jgi:hypothetical protein
MGGTFLSWHLSWRMGKTTNSSGRITGLWAKICTQGTAGLTTQPWHLFPHMWSIATLEEQIPSKKVLFSSKQESVFKASSLSDSWFLAYFPKMKVGLWDRLSVCPPLITFELLGKSSWYLVGGWCYSRVFDAIIFNPISSTILKWLRFKVVSWRHDFQLSTAMVGDCLIIGLLWLCPVGQQWHQGGDVTVETRPVVYCRAKRPKGSEDRQCQHIAHKV